MLNSLRSGIVILITFTIFIIFYSLSQVFEEKKESKDKENKKEENNSQIEIEIEIEKSPKSEVEVETSPKSEVIKMTPLNTVKGISPIALKALKDNDINTLEEARKKTKEELKSIKGVGEKTIEIIFSE